MRGGCHRGLFAAGTYGLHVKGRGLHGLRLFFAFPSSYLDACCFKDSRWRLALPSCSLRSSPLRSYASLSDFARARRRARRGLSFRSGSRRSAAPSRNARAAQRRPCVLRSGRRAAERGERHGRRAGRPPRHTRDHDGTLRRLPDGDHPGRLPRDHRHESSRSGADGGRDPGAERAHERRLRGNGLPLHRGPHRLPRERRLVPRRRARKQRRQCGGAGDEDGARHRPLDDAQLLLHRVRHPARRLRAVPEQLARDQRPVGRHQPDRLAARPPRQPRGRHDGARGRPRDPALPHLPERLSCRQPVHRGRRPGLRHASRSVHVQHRRVQRRHRHVPHIGGQ